MRHDWYVLRSKPWKEEALSRLVQSNGYEVFYPRIPARPVNPRARKVLPYFPGYLFVRTGLQDARAPTFRWMPFSQGLVRVGGEPASVSDLIVCSIQSRVAQIWESKGLPHRAFNPGDRLIVEEGVFEGYRGIFDAYISGNERVRILLQMLNDRFIPVEIEADRLSKLQS
jgi:transcriptional antiterminator RfaH